MCQFTSKIKVLFDGFQVSLCVFGIQPIKNDGVDNPAADDGSSLLVVLELLDGLLDSNQRGLLIYPLDKLEIIKHIGDIPLVI